ncbi:Phage derived protein Gp49-like [Marinitoga hydrogenitolerans DSM 16785]|uniref:Phage derived protein Gp49-like n=1 Tax=Marinitoga hydrogenitolerans (strain DSM 16785 / JCM 12826 / AT1271) TaxID=1122195 RepID=A0A1M5A6U1_MARH1|nr:type II toxin-antitoxin system RelE/ParE family toxin [Marinitoga hydrogenitolerans]SHF25542.1 Phage derived protein Gp49-like [Marinitoga hydrogenitolerans DSM 16785]
MWLWENYTVYFYDEKNGKNYIEKFIEELSKLDAGKMAEIMNVFFDRIENGIGIPYDFIKNKTIKELKGNNKIYEYRNRSSKLKKQIRIYFCVDDFQKHIIILHAAFKENKKSQQNDIKVAERRKKDYFKNSGGE